MNSPKTDQKVETLLRRMTLEEKIGQLVLYSDGQPLGPGKGVSDIKDFEKMIQKGQISAIINSKEPARINAYQRIAMEQSRLQIPILFSLDITHGFQTVFPIPLGLASSWEPGMVEQTARTAAHEAYAKGIRWTYSPMIDIARDIRWGRISEGSGEDPYVVSTMAEAYVKGYQGKSLSEPGSIAACVKHFVGYGAVEGGRDYNSTDISEHTLRSVYLPPFHAALKAGAASLMSAFNSLNGVPATANPFTLKQILRKEWGFKGLVVSDWSSISELVAHGIALDVSTAGKKAFLAGVDMDMGSQVYQRYLQKLVESGQIEEKLVDEAVRHVLRVKLALGLFERPYADETPAKNPSPTAESLALAETAAEKSFILLRNANGPNGKPLLPLTDAIRNIAVIGPLGDDPSYPEGIPEDAGPRERLFEILAQRPGAAHISRYWGTGVLNGTDQDITAAVEGAKQSDLVIMALGEDITIFEEAASRAHPGLPGRQQELLEAIIKTGKPVVLVLFSGRPLTIPWVFENVPAVIAAWFPGVRGMTALVRTLYGDSNPSGKLVVSWPRSVGQLPLYFNALTTGRPAGNTDLTQPPNSGDSKYVSRYVDEQNSPQFPFGYGGSYTQFAYGNTTLSTGQLSAKSLNKALGKAQNPTPVMRVKTTVSNTGIRSGEEVVQLYLQLRGTSIATPARTLTAYQKIKLDPGEQKTVEFELEPESFAIWNDQNKFAVEPAKITLWTGPNSAEGTSATAEIVP